MNNGFRVAVDVGNSSIKVALETQGPGLSDVSKVERTIEVGALKIQRFSLTNENWFAEIVDFVDSKSAGANAEWMLASVNDPACNEFTSWLARNRPGDSICEIKREHLPITIDVRYPGRVGIDRLLATIAAREFSAVTEPGGLSPTIAIDAGTTITVDVADANGVFRGGAIIPGVGLQFRMLHSATDRLPDIEVPKSFNDLETPGRDTEAAMRLGVINGIVSGINRLVELYENEFGDAAIYVTGGDSAALSRVLQRDNRVVPGLPLYGLYRLELPN